MCLNFFRVFRRALFPVQLFVEQARKNGHDMTVDYLIVRVGASLDRSITRRARAPSRILSEFKA